MPSGWIARLRRATCERRRQNAATIEPASGDWRRGSALPSHGRGHWFDPSIAHHGEFLVCLTGTFLHVQWHLALHSYACPANKLARRRCREAHRRGGTRPHRRDLARRRCLRAPSVFRCRSGGPRSRCGSCRRCFRGHGASGPEGDGLQEQTCLQTSVCEPGDVVSRRLDIPGRRARGVLACWPMRCRASCRTLRTSPTRTHGEEHRRLLTWTETIRWLG